MNSNYSFRYELTDPKAQNIVRLITESVQVENIRFLFAMPWIRHFLPEITGWNTQKKVLRFVTTIKEIKHKFRCHNNGTFP